MAGGPDTIPIQAYMRQLAQEADQLEWDGQFDLADNRKRELRDVQDYHESTGSLYYPMF